MASFGKHTISPGFKSGEHWVVCDRCGFDYYSSDVIEEWTGSVVCKEWCFEPRHPQDFVRGVEDNMSAQGYQRPDQLEANAPDLSESEESLGTIQNTDFGTAEISDANDSGTSPVPQAVAPHYEGNDSTNTNPSNNSVVKRTDGEDLDISVDHYEDDLFQDVTWSGTGIDE